MRRPIFLVLALFGLLPQLAGPSRGETRGEVVEQAMNLISPVTTYRKAAIDYFVSRGKPDAIPALVLALRFAPSGGDLAAALEKLAGVEPGKGPLDRWALWSQWMLWQETHPEVKPFAGFDDFQSRIFRLLDDNFGVFLQPGIAHEIRLEEITWGGVLKDGIPALTNPKLIAPAQAAYLTPDELVFGIEINGDIRAYPLRIMDWHEMLNDVIGGVPVSLAYCTLCGSGILFETAIAGRPEPFVFGSSGFLFRSNKLMYDSATHSLWNQFTGRPVVGPLTGSGIELRARPVAITTWADWLAHHPETKVLAIATGHARDYRPGLPYGEYFASPDLMFPAKVDQTRFKQKDHVFALRSSGIEQSWPLALFAGGAVVNDRAGVIDLVLIGDAATRTVRAYRTDGRTFSKGASPDRPLAGALEWRLSEDALIGPAGESFPRLPGHIAYWFAWNGYYGGIGRVSTPSP